MAAYETLEVAKVGEVTLVHFVNLKLHDAALVERFGRELAELVEAEKNSSILLDYSNVESMSSLALGKLIILDKLARKYGAVLRMCNLSDGLRSVFALAKLDGLFDIYPTQAEAVAAFS